MLDSAPLQLRTRLGPPAAHSRHLLSSRPLARSSLPARDPAAAASATARRGWLVWTVFIVYGSLVPLQFQAVPLDAAWQRLIDAPLLQVGLEGRADWIANGVLYLPFGLLGCLALSGRSGRPARAVAAALASWLLALALAGAVEFTQAYFPPRTVSRNDLLAEAVGALLGVLLGLGSGPYLHALLASLAGGGHFLRGQLGRVYAVAFVVLALFPYDLLLSAAEWTQKLHNANVAWLMTRGDPPIGTATMLAKLLAEALTAMPLGAWWAAARLGARPTPDPGLPWGPVLLRGAVLGATVELLQLGLGSGVSQGLSVLTRAVGFAAGVLAWQRAGALHVESLRAAMRRVTGPVLLLYLPLLALHHGWGAGGWLALDSALQRLDTEVHFVPFYYHYFTTEMRAVVSLAAAVASYAPVGLLCWAWHVGARTAGVMAGLLALGVEFGRLLSLTAKPDPTNVLIAAVSAWAAHRLVGWLLATPRTAASATPRPPAEAR